MTNLYQSGVDNLPRTNKSVELGYKERVDRTEYVLTENVEINKEATCSDSPETDKQVEVKEVSRICLHDQDKGAVYGMVVYNQRVYVVHSTGLMVYCYTPDGSLSHKYEHKGREKATIWGMCLMKDGDTAMLVVSDDINESLIWINIINDCTMNHYHTQQLDYSPLGLNSCKEDLMVCGSDNQKIQRYRLDGQTLAVINLSDNVKPFWVTRHSDGDNYVVSDWNNNQVVMIDN